MLFVLILLVKLELLRRGNFVLYCLFIIYSPAVGTRALFVRIFEAVETKLTDLV